MALTKIKLGTFCELVGAKPRDARYVLEQGFVPRGVEVSPATGNHRQFGPGESFWLAMAVKLKQAGLPVPLAATVADWGVDSVRQIARNLNWDWAFDPQAGQFDTQHRYVLEVADFEFIRITTTANPGLQGLYAFDWTYASRPNKPVGEIQPFVVIQVDMSLIARALTAIDWC